MIRFACPCAVLSALLAGCAAGGALAAGIEGSAETPRYDPLQTFAPLTLPDPVSRYRAGNGAPGPDYWQNRADYTIHAQLDPRTKTLRGRETITYTNNSPQALDGLWLQLDQNMYRRTSRSTYAVDMPRSMSRALHVPEAGGFTSGDRLDSVEVEQHGHLSRADYLVSDTRLQIRLRVPLASHASLRLQIAWHYTVPGPLGGRTGWASTRNGNIFDIAQWYPRMAVFDDLRGWNTLPYLANEFYLEYGDFDYFITVPADMIVVGSGELVNPRDVLTAQERARLAEARQSDRTVMIRSPAEVSDPASRPQHSGTLTWHFRMRHTRDVAFAASRAFVWDAARIDLPSGRHALAMSVYPVESAGAGAWGRATQYFKDAVQNFSRRWYPYPWPTAVNVAGPVSGMEYPGMGFDGMRARGKALFWISAHEIGHSWFPMIVGTNERRAAWMDEGFNTFMDVYESEDFDHGEYAPKRDPEYAPGGGNPVEEIEKVLRDPNAPPIVTRPDEISEKYRHPVTYFKAALGLVLLREQILGKARFDFAFRKFIRDWAYKHPSPSDFFRAMDSAGGEDLSWFWRGWFFHNWKLDLAVEKVAYTDGDPAKGATVTLANLDRLVMPATVEVDYADGSKRRLRVPVATWIQQRRAALSLPGGGPIAEVIVDPDQVIPDEDRGNDVLRGPFKLDAAGPTEEQVRRPLAESVPAECSGDDLSELDSSGGIRRRRGRMRPAEAALDRRPDRNCRAMTKSGG
ncbi:MAG: M1 family metallopeptidase [Steroidobacteraceae bacterium]